MSPLSQSQLGIFYACQDLGENDGNYQVPALYKLPVNIDVIKLKLALETVIKGHQYILSKIVLHDDILMMQPGDFSENIVEIREINNLDEVRPTFCRTMDLMNDRLFRMEIYKTPEANYLYLDFHHIIIDGSSWGFLMSEIGRAYSEGAVLGEIYDGHEIANAELKLRQSEEWNTQRDWYLNEFANAEETDSMPVPSNIDRKDNDRGLVETNFQIPVKLATLEAICSKHNVKEGVAFLAAWGKLLANYTAEDKAFFGTIYSGRGDKNLRQTLTMMVHTLPVFMEVPSHKNIGEWLHAVDEQQKLTREKNAYSFADIHQDLNLRSDILFAYHGKVVPTTVFNFKLGDETAKGLDMRIARPGITLDGQLHVTPNATESSDYNIRISYQSALYSSEMIAEMADAYAAIINSMADAETIADLNASSAKQIQWLDQRNPEKPMEYPQDKTVIDLFNENVEDYPDHECCVFENNRYSYKQIDALTDRLAIMIQQKVKRSGDSLPVVSFVVPRNELMLVVPVAIVKAGCTYQPLDSSYPKERLNFMIQDAEAQLLICTDEFRPLLDEYQGETLIVNDMKGLIAEAKLKDACGVAISSLKDLATEAKLEKVAIKADDTFILLYTSGTTGTPKGVMLTNRNILTLSLSHAKEQAIDNQSIIGAYASYGFDAYLMDLWAAMTHGAALHILSEDIRYDLVALHDYIEKEKVSHVFMTTQVGTQMAVNFPDIPSLKVLFVGGEKLVSIDPPKYRFINGYGPTETLAYVAAYDVCQNEKNIPIGFATQNAQLYVVSKDLKRVPMGAIGELWVSGAQTSKGYLKQAEKTAAVFVDNPFGDGSRDFAKAYRTGDIVRYREDGAIEFIGRKDGQVKIRGFRIELKEVEAVIRDYPSIKNVTVQAFDLEAGGKAIAAYIVSDEQVDIQKLNAFIMEQKPPYMVPAVTMQIDEIPLNVNGKVDKKRLPEPVVTVADNSEEDRPAAPLNCLEEELMQMICELANCKEFSIVTPLQYVGLTSITSIKLSTQLFKRYGVTVSNKELHDATLQSIENIILTQLLNPDKQTDNTNPQTLDDNSSLLITNYSLLINKKASLSNAQLGVFYECLKDPNSTVYNVPFIIDFPKSVKPEQLKAAVETVIAAHPLLLAHFDNTVDPPVQLVDPQLKPFVTISEKDINSVKDKFVQPFDLMNGPLYRAVICGNTLLFDAHHLVMDGASVSVIMHHVCDALEGKTVLEETYTAFDYVNDEQKADTSGAEAYFNEQLSKIDEATSIPADLRGNEAEGRAAYAKHSVDHAAVEKFARELNVTPASVYLAAVEYLAARYSNSKDVCLCTVSSGRSNVKIADTVGMFVNTLMLTSHIDKGTVADYIRNVSDNFHRTLENENYPFAKISEKYNLNAEVVFVYEVGVIDRFAVNGEDLIMNKIELTSPKFKTTFLIDEEDGKVMLVAEYNNALYSAEMMRRMMESLHQIIVNMISNPTAPIAKVSIISPAQQAEVDKMHCVMTYPKPISIFHQGMEKWAKKTPDHLALIATDITLTYKEFDLMANRIGNALLKHGVKKGDAVIVLLPRRGTTTACIYGIMKAGGAFIPCDPEYPTERIQLIAEDSGAPFVVTTPDLVGQYGQRGIVIDDLLSETNDKQPDVNITPDDLAYYIYTSGSTGRPKGVRVAHRNITTCVSTTLGHPYSVLTHQCERICSVATISFDASIFDHGMVLFNGRTLVFANEEETKDPIALTALLKRNECDYMCCTTSRLLQYMELPEFVECLKHFKCILQGGEKFSDILLAKLNKINDKLVIINGYGPTEVSISCNAGDLQKSDVVTVGKPLPNYTEWILDKDENELPVGVTGELCAGGEGITLGYNNLPDKTAEKYITYGGMRAFKTGDYARWMPNGEVEILGRTDNQVKLRGLRIELGEVEGSIAQVEGIKNVLVKICNIQGRDHLSAYFVADREIDINELKKTISTTLTAYMVPTAYLQMDKFPITPNGKVDFRNLPEPKLAQTGGEYVAPANATEKFFADTFAQILGLDKVSATDSFFDLGGTSLVVMKVVINAQQAGYQISYADVFANPSARKLAVFLGNNTSNADNDPDADVRDFDYQDIDKQLQMNTLDQFKQNNELRPLGSVLLTGATGFLGIHVLRCIIDNYPDSTVHCLLRSKGSISAEERLRQLVFYYFEKDYADLFGKRIFVHEGDVTSSISIDAPIDTVMNCAAIVKHFAKGTEIEDVNVGGVKNCIDFCLSKKARLIQVSTYSVAGASVNGLPDVNVYTEQMLYLGQRIHNQYIHSKIMGERLLLDAVAKQGLDGKIMRVGNLSARSEDGEFQINVKTNSFMGRLRIYQMLGALPYSAYQSPVEFSPIDETAEAICLLAQTNGNCTVFHPYNSHQQMLGDILKEMKTIGKNVQLVEDNEFIDILNSAKADPSKQEKLSAMLAYESGEAKDIVRMIPADNNYTLQVLLRLGFHWDSTSWDYIDRFLKQIDGLLFFDDVK